MVKKIYTYISAFRFSKYFASGINRGKAANKYLGVPE